MRDDIPLSDMGWTAEEIAVMSRITAQQRAEMLEALDNTERKV